MRRRVAGDVNMVDRGWGFNSSHLSAPSSFAGESADYRTSGMMSARPSFDRHRPHALFNKQFSTACGPVHIPALSSVIDAFRATVCRGLQSAADLFISSLAPIYACSSAQFFIGWC
jgi:hypothetical protein